MRKPRPLDALALGFPRYLYPLSTELAIGLSYFSHVSDRARRSIKFLLFKITFSWVILFCSPMWASFSSVKNCVLVLVSVGVSRARVSFDCVGMPVVRL